MGGHLGDGGVHGFLVQVQGVGWEGEDVEDGWGNRKCPGLPGVSGVEAVEEEARVLGSW